MDSRAIKLYSRCQTRSRRGRGSSNRRGGRGRLGRRRRYADDDEDEVESAEGRRYDDARLFGRASPSTGRTRPLKTRRTTMTTTRRARLPQGILHQGPQHAQTQQTRRTKQTRPWAPKRLSQMLSPRAEAHAPLMSLRRHVMAPHSPRHRRRMHRPMQQPMLPVAMKTQRVATRVTCTDLIKYHFGRDHDKQAVPNQSSVQSRRCPPR